MKLEVPISHVAAGAAIVALASYIPAFPVIGSGATMSAGMFITPLIGILLGPISGMLAAAIGGLIGEFIAPYIAVFGPLTFLLPTTCAFVAGLVAFGRWKEGASAEAILLAVWYILTSIWWQGQEGAEIRWYFPFLHIITLILVIVIGPRISEWIATRDKKKIALGIFLAALAGTISQHLLGNAFFIAMYSGPAKVFAVVLFVYPIERLLAATIATIIGVPLLLGLRKIGMELGPSYKPVSSTF